MVLALPVPARRCGLGRIVAIQPNKERREQEGEEKQFPHACFSSNDRAKLPPLCEQFPIV